MSDTRVGLLLNKLPELQALKEHLANCAILQSLVTDILPGHLSTGVSGASLKGSELILTTDNGAVASKLRQLAPRIMNSIRQHGYEITGIELQVQVRMFDKPLPRKQLLLGRDARSAISLLLERLEASPLKGALERLASRGSED